MLGVVVFELAPNSAHYWKLKSFHMEPRYEFITEDNRIHDQYKQLNFTLCYTLKAE